MARTLKKNDRILADIKVQRGLDRQAHFSAGGTIEAWRGKHLVQVDRRKEQNRKACRKAGGED